MCSVTKPHHFPAFLETMFSKFWLIKCEQKCVNLPERPNRKCLTWESNILSFSTFPPFYIFPGDKNMIAGAPATMFDHGNLKGWKLCASVVKLGQVTLTCQSMQ